MRANFKASRSASTFILKIGKILLAFFEKLNLKANAVLQRYYSLFYLAFVVSVAIYGIAFYFFIEWMLVAATVSIYAFFAIMAFYSLFWFVISLICSPIFVVMIMLHYENVSLIFSIFLAAIWTGCWLFLSLAVSQNIAKPGNEIVSKILRIISLFMVIGVYYVSVENALDLNAILKDTMSYRVVLIVINLYMFPSLITMLVFDLQAYYLENRDRIRLKFSFFGVLRNLFKILRKDRNT